MLHAVDRVRQVVEEGGSLADAADALENDSDDSSEVESLPLEPGKSDVVRVMNLHKAKGLEAAVVFLADPCGGVEAAGGRAHRARRAARCRVVPRRRRSESSYASKLLGEPADWSTHEAAELPYLVAEEDRLLYVAATRAREMLVVSRWPVKPAGSDAWGVLNGFLQGAKELVVPANVSPAAIEPADCSPAARDSATSRRVAAHQRVRTPSWSMTSVTAEARHIARMTRTVETEPDDPTGVVRTDAPTNRADAGIAWGTLIHGLLEHAMRHPGATRDDLRRLAMWLTVEEPQLRVVIDEALDTVQRVAADDFWAEARAASAAYEEVPFGIADTGPDGLQLVNGVIDLVFGGDSEWSIVDYKTDAGVDIESLTAKYASQLEAYRRAWATVTGKAAESRLVKAR